jgi:hypothetical protein
MGAKVLLNELMDLVRHQTEAVIVGDYKALIQGAARHEELLAELETAEVDLPSDTLREMCQDLERAKAKLESLLSSGVARTDFLLRLMMRGGEPSKTGYSSTGAWKQAALSQRLNRRT